MTKSPNQKRQLQLVKDKDRMEVTAKGGEEVKVEEVRNYRMQKEECFFLSSFKNITEEITQRQLVVPFPPVFISQTQFIYKLTRE